MRQYARNDKNEIIKANNDHVIDAMRYAVVHFDMSKKRRELEYDSSNRTYQAESNWY
jgi:hypothetical protein